MIDEIKEQQQAIAAAVREEAKEEKLAANTTVNLPLESTILSVCIRDADAFDTAKSLINARDFHAGPSKSIWEVLTALSERGVDHNVVTIVSELEAAERLKAVGGREAVEALAASTEGKSSEVSGYCQQLRNFTIAREQKRIAGKLDTLSKTAMPGEERIGKTRELMDGLVNLIHSQDSLETLEQVIARIGYEKFMNPLQGESFVDTPWGKYNDILIGFRRGTLNLLGARPSQGKSSLAGCIALKAALSGIPVAYFSLEMMSSSLFLRCCCNIAMVSGFKVMKNITSPEEKTRLGEAASALIDKPLFISNLGGFKASSVDMGIRRLTAHGVKPALVIIDHIQLMRPERPHKDPRGAFTEISHHVLEIAQRRDLAILALSQLRRPGKKEQSEPPTMDDFMETGYLEADAYTCSLIHRPHFYKTNTDRAKTIIHLQKHRDGPTGRVELKADDKHFRFEEVDSYEDEE